MEDNRDKENKKVSVVICLCVYNNEEGLPYCLNNIEAIRDIFNRVVVNVVYDNSQDRSLQILNDFNKYNINKPLNKRIFMNITTNRIKRNEISKSINIANCRNILLDIIRERYSDYDYFIMMDTNEYSCIGKINVKLMYDIINSNNNNYLNEYDAVSFDREAGYYDWWALSFDPFIYSVYHTSDKHNVLQKMSYVFKKILKFYKENHPKKPIPVFSAFNGFAIYKMEKFLNCSYSANIDIDLFPKDIIHKMISVTKSNIINNFNNDCEHRKFHLEAIKKNNAKIGVSTEYMFFRVNNPRSNLRGPA